MKLSRLNHQYKRRTTALENIWFFDKKQRYKPAWIVLLICYCTKNTTLWLYRLHVEKSKAQQKEVGLSSIDLFSRVDR